jgi:hypothetical protein
MTPETEVIACPACKHPLRVPLDWLGTQVQCPECKAMFLAPVREHGKLGAPQLLSRPGAPAAAPRPKGDPMLLMPAFGLLLIGFAGLTVNVWTTVRHARDDGAATNDVLQITQQGRQTGLVNDGPEDPAARAQFDEERAARRAKVIRVLVPLFAVVSALVFYGGIAIATRRHYRMAQLGCALAMVNIANGCCIPGAVAGLWGLLMLNSDEGREHFLK